MWYKVLERKMEECDADAATVASTDPEGQSF